MVISGPPGTPSQMLKSSKKQQVNFLMVRRKNNE
jgi:hypothetical protein